MINALYTKVISCPQKIKNIHVNYYYHLIFGGTINEVKKCGGGGAVLYDSDFKECWNGSLLIDKNTTKNKSEYVGLLLGLEEAIRQNIKLLIVRGDNELIINHMKGRSKCKSVDLLEDYTKAKKLENEFKNIKYIHVLSECNKRANEVSNNPINEYIMVKEYT